MTDSTDRKQDSDRQVQPLDRDPLWIAAARAAKEAHTWIKVGPAVKQRVTHEQ